MPTQYGTGAAVSSSADNLRPDLSKLPSSGADQTIVPLGPDSDAGQTIVPLGPGSGGDQTIVPLGPGSGGEQTIVPLGSRPDSAYTMAGVPDSAVYRPSDGASGQLAPLAADGDLPPHTVLAGRYEIEKVLGTGGMGAVYRACDRELDRLVALKVIRPELARNQAIVDRFKQELRLSHLVTHRNVVRMYDLGEAHGMRFVTMELVAGRDLHTILAERGTFPPREAVEVFKQICYALQAAHSVGILHRDLKPQNVMVEDAGRVVVMDFGLARTIEGNGMTQSGALVGTMEYMSPEQALGKDLDQRSDIFALGLIGYEMLTGNMPFRAESAIASLLKRTQTRADPCITLNADIPGALSDIISKCLECDVNDRYASVTDILNDLEAWQGKSSGVAVAAPISTIAPPAIAVNATRKWILIGGGAVLVVAIAAGVPYGIHHFGGGNSPVSATPSISLAIIPFYNASGDPSLDWLGSSLAQMLADDVGQSSAVRMVSQDRLQQIIGDLHLSPNSQIDEANLKRIAGFTNAQTIVFGQYIRAGSQIRVSTTILDLAHDTRSVLTTDVPQEKELLPAVDKLAVDLRQKLTADPKILKDLKAHAERPSTTSVDALRAYQAGVTLSRAGNDIKAQEQYQAAIAADPRFALAYSKLAETYSNLGHDDLARTAARRAVELSESLPPQERYLIEASNARVTNDTQKAISSYQQLAAANPADTEVQFALAALYEKDNDYAEAKKRLASVLANDPKNVEALLASGRVAVKADDPRGGLEFLSRALPLATELDNQQEKASILQAMGVAYSSLDRPDDALKNLKDALAIRQQIGDKRGAAASLNQIAQVYDSQGKVDDALDNYKQALAIRRDIGDQAGIASTLIDTGTFYHDHGKPADALQYYTEALQIERQLGDRSRQALCLNNIGTIKLDQGQYQDALTYLEQALDLRQKLGLAADTGESLHNLAEVSTKLGQYDTALNDYLKAIEVFRGINDQHGIALESSGMAKIFAAQGRYGAAQSAMKDALTIIRQSKETTSLAAEVIGGWGDLMGQVGKPADGRPSLDEALKIAQQTKDDPTSAQVTNWMGDAYFYAGDYANARKQYDRALQIASKTTDKEVTLIARVNRSKTDLAMGHAAAVAPEFKKMSQEADELGLKALSVECSVYLAQAELATKNTRNLDQDLSETLAKAENLGLRILQAKTHYLQASLQMGAGNKNEAVMNYRDVANILEGISKEKDSGDVLKRADLKEIYSSSKDAVRVNY